MPAHLAVVPSLTTPTHANRALPFRVLPLPGPRAQRCGGRAAHPRKGIADGEVLANDEGGEGGSAGDEEDEK